MAYKRVDELTPAELEERHRKQREAYQRNKLKKEYYLSRWKYYFDTGKLLPLNFWEQVWQRRQQHGKNKHTS